MLWVQGILTTSNAPPGKMSNALPVESLTPLYSLELFQWVMKKTSTLFCMFYFNLLIHHIILFSSNIQ